MQHDSLFHAYVVGGARESARAHIAELLSSYKLGTKEDADLVVTEQVNFTIDNARALRGWQDLRNDSQKPTVYIVYTDFITREAENALLKTLEEPVLGTHIILAVPKPDILLPTLLSRVRVIANFGAKSLGEPGDLAPKFLAMKPAERLALVGKIVEKSDDEEAAAEVRERTLALLDSLEAALSEFPEKNMKKLESILRLKKYLYISGASSRIILETLALVL